MFIRIEKVEVGRQQGAQIKDYHKFPGYNISLSWNNQNWQIIGINDGLTLAEVQQLRSELNKLEVK